MRKINVLEHVPFRWNHLNEKPMRKINVLEHVPFGWNHLNEARSSRRPDGSGRIRGQATVNRAHFGGPRLSARQGVDKAALAGLYAA